MKIFDDKIYIELLSKATEKLRQHDKTYKSDFFLAFEFVCQIEHISEFTSLVNELKKLIPLLAEENIHSHQNIELYKYLMMTLEIIKPIHD